MTIKHLLILLPCFFLLVISPAQAIEINDAGAAKLKTMFTDILNTQKQTMVKNEQKMEVEGDITVEQGKGYYAVTLPAITHTDKKGEKIKFGMIAINATPTDNPDNWKMSVAIPSSILFFDKDGKPDMRLDIGTQRMGGLWSEKLGRFTKMIAQYNNLKVIHTKKKEIMTIGQFDLVTDLDENKDSKWSGTANITLTDFGFGLPGLPPATIFKESKINVSLENFQLEGVQPDDDAFSLIPNAGSGISIQGMVSGLSAKTPKQNTVLKSALFNLSIDAQESGLVNGSLSLGYSDLKSTGMDNLIPTDLNTKISLNKLPINDLVKQAEQIVFNSDPEAKSAQQVAAVNMMMTAPQKMVEAGTNIIIENTQVRSPLYGFDVNGKLNASATSSLHAVGDVTATFYGLDNTIDGLSQKMGAAPAGEKEKLTNLMKYMILIKGISKKEGNNNICHLTLDDAGSIKVNGQDMNALMQAAQ